MEEVLNQTLLTSLAIHSADQAIIVANAHGQITRINLAAESLFSCIEIQVLKTSIKALCEPRSYEVIYPRLLNGEISSWKGELDFVKTSGKAFPARVSLSVIRDHEGEQIGILSILSDITKERQLEEQLRQSQKMDAIGQMAGGVAHDFNNLLQIILGNADLALADLEDKRLAAENLAYVLEAAERGASLTRRLLVFSRKHPLNRERFNLNELVIDLVQMLRRMIEERITIKFLVTQGLWDIFADRGMIEQVLINLCLNARDAMPEGGELILQTENASPATLAAREIKGIGAGEYLVVTVTDNGTGIHPEHLQRIFEPFFTTKEPAKGTGLGLSMAYEILQKHEGAITVDSEVGVGTTVRIYLPKSEQKTDSSQARLEEGTRGGSESILVVEDEQGVRDLVCRLLGKAGYRVVAASNGAEALAVSEQGDFDLALLDVVMPGMDGKEVYESLKDRRIAERFLFMSGYPAEAIGTKFMESHSVPLIQKPFSPDQLLRTIRNELDAKPPSI